MTLAFPDLNRHFRQRQQLALAGIMLSCFLVAGGPALAGDPATGKTLALRWCAACHLVADDQPKASSASLPSFYDMARNPDWSEEKLATFLADPHPSMPGMSLGNTEIANLSAYIGSLAP
ncbi:MULTISPECIES: c-type cytochrome [unclassified Roseibium]|uniref:c-type cytochrome n=1 Tax=unclassified Roseibium TaxID=2629323 RepID=UPI00317F5D6C